MWKRDRGAAPVVGEGTSPVEIEFHIGVFATLPLWGIAAHVPRPLLFADFYGEGAPLSAL